MNKIARHWNPTMLPLSIFLLTFAIAACGGNEEAREDVPTATVGETSSATTPTAAGAGGTPAAASPTATPVADEPDTSSVSLDEYIMTVCGETVTEVGSWEGGDSLRDLSAGLGYISEQMSALEPPMEVAEWHDAQLEFADAFKETIDDFLEDPGDQTEDEFLVSMFFTVAPQFATVEEAIANMDPDIRVRMAETGCIDEEASDPVSAEPERAKVPVGGSVDGELAESDPPVFLQFQAEMGQKYLIGVSWEGITRVRLLIKDPPDPRVSFIDQSNSSDSPLVRRWTAPESGTFHIELYAREGTGSFTVSVAIDATPDSPVGVSAVREGSSIRLSWDPVDRAEYYIVYHDDRGPGCELLNDGTPSFCDELATNVTGTTYVHSSPQPEGSRRGNYYWVAPCNSEGCSEIDSDAPASP